MRKTLLLLGLLHLGGTLYGAIESFDQLDEIRRSESAPGQGEVQTTADAASGSVLVDYHIHTVWHYITLERDFGAARDCSKAAGAFFELEVLEGREPREDGGPAKITFSLILDDGSVWSFYDSYLLQKPGEHTLRMPWAGFALNPYSPTKEVRFDPARIVKWRIEISRVQTEDAYGKVRLIEWGLL